MYTDWHSLGDVLYRKWHVYDMAWKDEKDFNTHNFHVCGAPFGGPLAIIKDDLRSNTSLLSNSAIDSKLWIYTSSGNQLAEVSLEPKKIAGSGWNDQEQLVTVQEDGNFGTSDKSFL